MTDIYLIDTELLRDEGLFRAALEAMPRQRREKVAKYRFDKDRRLSLGAGVALDYALRRRGLAPDDDALGRDSRGKPFLKKGPLFFNLSHSGHRAVCALSDGEIGVDIEELRAVREGQLRAAAAPGELARLLSLPEGGAREDAFFRMWTAKESFSKLQGQGLSLPPRSLEVEPGPPVALSLGSVRQSVFFREYPVEGYRLTACSAAPLPPAEPEWITAEWLEGYLTGKRRSGQ